MAHTESLVALGKVIKLIRLMRDMKQSELAKQAGLSVSYICLLERGKRDMSWSTIWKISKALQIPVFLLTYLVVGREELENVDLAAVQTISHIAVEAIQKGISW